MTPMIIPAWTPLSRYKLPDGVDVADVALLATNAIDWRSDCVVGTDVVVLVSVTMEVEVELDGSSLSGIYSPSQFSSCILRFAAWLSTVKRRAAMCGQFCTLILGELCGSGAGWIVASNCDDVGY